MSMNYSRSPSDPFLDTSPLSKALPPTLAHLMNDSPLASEGAGTKPKLSRTQNLFSGKRLSVIPPGSQGTSASLAAYRITGGITTPTNSNASWAGPPTAGGGLPTPGGSTIYQSNDIQIRKPKLPQSPLPRPSRPSQLAISQTPLSISTLPHSSGSSSPDGSSGFPFPVHTPPLTPSYESPSSPGAQSPCEVRTPGDDAPLTDVTHMAVNSPEQYKYEDEQQDDGKPEGTDGAPTVSAKYLSRYNLHPAFASQYVLSDELGSGGFGFVVKGSRPKDGLDVAVKFIFKDRVPSHGWIRKRFPDGRGGFIYEIIPTEVYVLQRIRHRGVVAFVDLFEDATFFYLVMELHGSTWSTTNPKEAVQKTSPMTLPALAKAAVRDLPPSPVSPAMFGNNQNMTRTLSAPMPPPFMRRSSCDLFECIEQHSKLSEDQARYVFAQIISVVFYLHSNGICHRDIKDENIVIDEKLKVKLIDFGSAVLFNPYGPLPAYDKFYGTIIFASPEILGGYAYQAPPAEVWSLGILFSVLLCGESIFRDSYHVLEGKIQQSMFDRLSRPCQDILRLCLHPDPLRRVTVAGLYKHPWLRATIQEIESQQ